MTFYLYLCVFIIQIYLRCTRHTGLMFEVIDGGFNDIELRITDPEGKVIHEGEEKSGKYTFGSGDPEAKYTYCFINEKGSMAPKTIMFNMDVLDNGRAPGAPNESEVGHNKLEDMVNDLDIISLMSDLTIIVQPYFRFVNWALVLHR